MAYSYGSVISREERPEPAWTHPYRNGRMTKSGRQSPSHCTVLSLVVN